ncbi:MAG: hypothetical protein JKY56_22925 [Kofleriaceae bacterium]|nr:hypothetical protein [Kofleriaceae bacterium]
MQNNSKTPKFLVFYAPILVGTLAFGACGSDAKPADADANAGLDASSVSSACENNPCATNDSAATCSLSDSAPGGYACECSAGYSRGEGSCVDTDACESNPCNSIDTGATCVDTAAPADGYSCTCSTGFEYDGTSCIALPCTLRPDVDGDGIPAYPFGSDLDDDGDGARTYLLGGRDTNDSDANTILATGDGSFSVVETYSLNRGGSPTGVVVADFNDDGNLDIAITDQSGSMAGEGGHVEVWLGGGNMGFAFASNASLTRGGGKLSTGDFNNDGALDLFNRGEVLFGNCDGTFTADNTLQTTLHESYVADLNGDGNLDIVGIEYDTGIVRLLGAGDGSFTEGTLAYSGVQALSIGFLDNNESLDVVADAFAFNAPYSLKTFTQSTMGALEEKTLYAVADEFNGNSVIGDVNNDGNSDVITHDFIANTINVFLGDGTGAIAAPTTVISNLGATGGKILVDVNGDGNRDLLITDQNTGFGASAGDGNGASLLPPSL